MSKNLLGLVGVIFFLLSCEKSVFAQKIYLGNDFSYVNEVEDCGGKFRNDGKEIEPFQFFKEKGANIARFRLWHNPIWTKYSTIQDLKKSIRRAKNQNMTILLDFHYSDTWADPAHQTIPKAWATIKDTKLLGDSVFNYTLNTLLLLEKDGLLPEIVQVGNEINSEVMQYTEKSKSGIDWKRNVFLLNKGIEAVNEASKKTSKNIETMLHIAQPDDSESWFKNAHENGILKYDWIGLSYYPKWSKFNMEKLSSTISFLKSTYQKRLMIVETGYPYSLQNIDGANNVLDGGISAYNISPIGQKNFMIDLTKAVLKGGGEGVIYWEAAWISNNCNTLWGKGSHWENAAFFDATNQNEALPVFEFFNPNNYK